MAINPIALAIPVFFVLIGVEFIVSRAKDRPLYRVHDAFTDISCGISSQVTVAFLKGGTFLAYIAVYEAWHVVEMPADAWWTWVVGFVGLDLLYYWWHRASHRVNVLWAAHVVHHQSQDYNLAVALRQAVFTSITIVPFYLPLALVGVPPWVYGLCSALNTLYQFWIHTRLVGRLGPAEWVMNTPSHHRVHHGINPECIDRNHAGVFIIWDRMFGTFVEEPDEEPVYGTVTPLNSWNPLWANLAYWGHIWHLVRASTTWRERIWAWFAPPEWQPAALGGDKAAPPVRRADITLWDTAAFPGTTPYAVFWFVPIAVAVTAFIQLEDELLAGEKAAAGLLIVATVLAWGALFEGRTWGLWLEKARLVSVAVAAGAMAASGALPQWALAITTIVLVGSAFWVWRMSKGPRGSATPQPAT